ncbi:PREDICTED: arogenate dehydrogenase 1, chloroplastic [Tarenaya hassleriana]|uniref:arogenate dehydrogenase 1, chloroplastic n=1 Tax=Tarenaya hassleriana TaxID=28532 RepID=UPI00053C6855|nr:PREDICTED: arogenate dehydrogenase 1, chloroplastic [Tarenaya hassleriana]
MIIHISSSSSSLHFFPIIKPSLSSSLSPHSVMIPSALSLPTTAAATTCRLSVVSAISGDLSSGKPTNPLRTLRIAIVGFGNYGQFIAETLVSQGHIVFAHSRSDHSAAARRLGVSFFADLHDLCERHPDVVILCTSIISTERVLRAFPFQRLRRNTLFVDVLSVKEFPKNLLIEILPNDFDVICTHPMFGPQSVRSNNGWRGLRFVYEKARIADEKSRISRCEDFLGIFEREGCKMVEMSCADHDRFAAGTQFITHTVGRVLEMLELQSTPINTKGYEALLDLVENTSGDSFDLYYGLFVYNKNSLEMLERMDLAFEALRKELFGRLHGVVRKQLFEGEDRRVNIFANGHPKAASLDMARSKDAAPKYEYNAELSAVVDESSKLKIAVIGFGNFGQFLAKAMVRQGHSVLAYSRTDYTEAAKNLGVSFFSDLDDLFEEHPGVILLCTSILSTEKVLKSLPLQRLKRSTLFVDVLSVKEFPRNLFLRILPPDFDILCTHPMFGPESGKNGWNGLSFVFDKVRIGRDTRRASRCDRFLDIFAREGCRMVEMSCAEHDWHAAGSQFITHTTGRVLEKLKLESTPVDTKGYETLLKLVENTSGDSFDLYYGLFLYNPNAMEQLERLDLAFESLKKQLFGRLHCLLHEQLFGNDNESRVRLDTTDLSTRASSHS